MPNTHHDRSTDRSIETQFSRSIKISAGVLILLAGWLTVDPQSPFRWGLVVGTVVGMINLSLTFNRIKYMLGDPNDPPPSPFKRMGFFMRWSMIIGVLFLGAFVEPLDIVGLMLGILAPQVINFVDFNLGLAFQNRKK